MIVAWYKAYSFIFFRGYYEIIHEQLLLIIKMLMWFFYPPKGIVYYGFILYIVHAVTRNKLFVLYDLVLIVCVFKFMLKSFFQSVDLISIFTLGQELIVGYLMGFTISCLEKKQTKH